jgi:hypothetical protein
MSVPLSEHDLTAAIAETRKVFFWIHAMAAVDASARRAFLLIEGVMNRIALPLGVDLAEWPASSTLARVHEGGRMEALDELVDFEGAGSFVELD